MEIPDKDDTGESNEGTGRLNGIQAAIKTKFCYKCRKMQRSADLLAKSSEG